MSSSLGSKSALALATQIGVQLTRIVTGIVVARYIGPSGKGFISYAATVLGLMNVFFEGFSRTIVYQYGKRKEPATAVYAASMRTITIAMLVLIPLLVGIAAIMPSQRALAVAAAALPFALYSQITNSFFLVAENVSLFLSKNVVQTVGTAVLTIPLLLFAHAGLPIVVGVWLFFIFVIALQSAVGLRPILAASPASREASPKLAAEQMSYGLRSAGVTVSGYLNLRVDVFIVSLTCSSVELGQYLLAILAGEVLWDATGALVWPSIGRIGSLPQPQAAQLVARITRNIVAIVGTGGLLAFVLGPWLIDHLYGPAYEPSVAVLRWALPGIVVYAVELPLTSYIMYQLSRPTTLIRIQAASAVVRGVVVAATVHRFGIAAAAASSLIYVSVMLVYGWIFLRSSGISAYQCLFLQAVDFARYRQFLSTAWRSLRFRSA